MLNPINSQNPVNAMNTAAARLLGLRKSHTPDERSAKATITEKIRSLLEGLGHAKDPDNGPRTVVRKNRGLQ